MMKLATSRLTIKGQVTIPKKFREHLQIVEGESVCFSINDHQEVVLSRVNPKQVCPLCERGFLHDFNDISLLKCPLCKGEQQLDYHSVAEWLKVSIDVASAFGVAYTLHPHLKGYLLHFCSDSLSLVDQVLVSRYEGFIQDQLNLATRKERSHA